MTADARDTFAIESLVPGFIAPQPAKDPADSAAALAAERTARHWMSAHPGEIRPGTELHKREVYRMFRDTFNPFRPSVIAWPALDAAALDRVQSLPIWDIAVQTEGKARLRMAAYAGSLEDADMRAAIALNAWEESRHKEVLSRLVEAYGIQLSSEPVYPPPRDSEWAYLVTGYSECVDSFFAFGLFEVARRSGFFPPELVETFEPVMQDECRHILLFANWLAWHRARLPWWRRLAFELRVAAVWIFLGWERIGLARSIDADGNEVRQDNNFTVTGAQSVSSGEVRVPDLLQLCLDENERRFSGYDPRLLRPTTMPALARLALRLARPRRDRPAPRSAARF